MARVSDASIVSTGSLSEELLEISPNFREGSSSRQDAASPLKGRTVSDASTNSSKTPAILEFPHELLSKILGYVPLAYKADSENLAPPTKKRKSFARRAIHSTTKRMTSIFRRKEKKAKTASTKNTSKKQSRESISDVCHLFRDIRMDYSNWKEWAKERGISIGNLNFPEGTIDIQEECQKQIPEMIIEEVKKRVETLDKSFPIRKKMLKALNSKKPMKISSLNGLLELRDHYTFFIHLANYYRSDPEILASLPRIKSKNFEDHKNALNEWFEANFDIFQNEEFLELQNLQLSSLPECISKLTKIKSLRLEGNHFTELPEWIGNFQQLMRLDISGNKLIKLPDWLPNLKQLWRLDISDINLTKLPEWIRDLELTQLDISGNGLTELPEWIGELRHLSRINASRNNLTELPESLKNLGLLRILSLDHNKLSSFPGGFEKLPALQWLYLNDNAFTEFPEEIEKLQSLRTVDVGNNSISDLPDSLVKSQKLQEIGIEGNPISELPNGILQEEDFIPGTIHYEHARGFYHEGPTRQ